MFLKTLVYLNIISTTFIIAQDVGDPCVPNNEISDGICTSVVDCEPAINEIKIKRRHDFQRCGFSGIMEVVCCPPTNNKFGSTERSTFDNAKRIADRECAKIRANNIEPLDLHIIGGEQASLGEFPHMVALGFDRGSGYEFDCGGSVIEKTYVLTAAHCVDTLDRIEPSIVRTGVIEIGGRAWNDETDVSIAQIIMHPSYMRSEKYDDLALLRLSSPLSYSSTLNAVCLDTTTNNPTTPLVITGWGKTNSTRNIRSTILLKANVTAVSSSSCGAKYTNWRKLPNGIAPEQLCAGDPDGLRDTCQGDSGGPLQGSDSSGLYKLVGVTSFGRGCGSDVPGVYTRVARYLPWIVGQVWPN